ncbi:response regulator transcription factor [Gracilibacillus xinjiangensis]|uniref:Response regulator n=1 Tax=Gracilibacillus xinjiangensis TaxID=1193282 RepID=A0ABV8WPP3_9BACI
MLKVLIIDDEPLIREGLCSIIDWENFGYEIVGTAKNGKEGLKYMELLKPDVVFVDIKMPGLSGIEMVKKAKEKRMIAKYIVLSGYSNFTYAQESIQLGMESYLLKPVDEEELIPLIQQVKAKCFYEKNVVSQLDQYKKIQEQHEWREWLHGNRTGKLLSAYEADSFIIASLVSQQFIDWETIETKVEKVILPTTKLIWIDNQLIVLFLNNSIESALASLRNLKEFIKVNSSAKIKIQVIDQLISLKGLPKAYDQLLSLQNFSYNFSDSVILCSSMINTNRGTFPLTEHLANSIYRAMEFENINQLEIYFDEIKSCFQNNLYQRERIRAEWLEFTKLIYRKIKFNDAHVSLESNERLVEGIYQAEDLETLLKQTKEMFIMISGHLNGFGSSSEDTIEKIIQYVEQYHYKDLTLKVIAELFKYNRSYLGKKFKNCTGDYFHVYLDKVRLGKAKQLLRQPDIKVYQVSEQVGYSNIDYFYRKFKKYMGISPKEYQKQQLNKEITLH